MLGNNPNTYHHFFKPICPIKHLSFYDTQLYAKYPFHLLHTIPISPLNQQLLTSSQRFDGFKPEINQPCKDAKA